MTKKEIAEKIVGLDSTQNVVELMTNVKDDLLLIWETVRDSAKEKTTLKKKKEVVILRTIKITSNMSASEIMSVSKELRKLANSKL